MASLDASGALAYGPAKLTSEGKTYRAVLDYVNVDAVAVPFYARKSVVPAGGSEAAYRGILAPVSNGERVVGCEAHVYYGRSTDSVAVHWVRNGFDPISVPVYVGLGMRLTADIRALKADVALSSLGSIAAQAQANALSGTLTVQTLGVTSPAIATALPLPSKLDQTTVENAILALGSSRAILYSKDASDVGRTARIVGLYSPVEPDPRFINVLYSELATNRPAWFRPCGPAAL